MGIVAGALIVFVVVWVVDCVRPLGVLLGNSGGGESDVERIGIALEYAEDGKERGGEEVFEEGEEEATVSGSEIVGKAGEEWGALPVTLSVAKSSVIPVLLK